MLFLFTSVILGVVKIGGPWTRSIFWWTRSMDPVHGGGPWTRGPCFVLSHVPARSTKHRKKSNELANERVTQILDEERCIKEQIYCKLLYFSCILFTSSVLLNCFSVVKFRAKFEACKKFYQSLWITRQFMTLFYRKLSSRRQLNPLSVLHRNLLIHQRSEPVHQRNRRLRALSWQLQFPRIWLVHKLSCILL